jgi:hypothetical protein
VLILEVSAVVNSYFISVSVNSNCARCDDDIHQRMNANGLSPYNYDNEITVHNVLKH